MIKERLGFEPRLQKGRPGEFRVLVDGAIVLNRGWFTLPREEAILAAVRSALGVGS